MAQDRESGSKAVQYGLLTAKKIAAKLGANKVGRGNSNEYQIRDGRIVIKCARTTTNSVGVCYQMLDRIGAVIGSFETEYGTYDIYELNADIYRDSMTPTRSKGASAERVGIVRKSVFLDRGKYLGNLQVI